MTIISEKDQWPRTVAGDSRAVLVDKNGPVEFWVNMQTGGAEPFVVLPLVNGRLPQFRVMVEQGGGTAVVTTDDKPAPKKDNTLLVGWLITLALSSLFWVGAWLLFGFLWR